MGIRKPSVSVTEAKRLAKGRSEVPVVAPLSTAPPLAGFTLQENVSPVVSIQDRPMQSVVYEIADDPVAPVRVARRTPGDGVFPELKPTEPKMQVFLSAPLPAPGVSPNFDALRRQYPSQKALQMILRRALDSYEVRLENGSYRTAPTDYAPGEPASGVLIIQTSRMVPVRLIEVAREHFDPLGFESIRAFGRKLACAALASFFETEKEQKK